MTQLMLYKVKAQKKKALRLFVKLIPVLIGKCL
jgi:hypothetical protein